jgi:hypothetical protein
MWQGRNIGERAVKEEGRRNEQKESGEKKRRLGRNRGGRVETEEAEMANKGIGGAGVVSVSRPLPKCEGGGVLIKKTSSSSISSCRHPSFWFLPEQGGIGFIADRTWGVGGGGRGREGGAGEFGRFGSHDRHILPVHTTGYRPPTAQQPVKNTNIYRAFI